MRRILLLLLSTLGAATLAFAIQPGNTEAEVVATLGKPNAIRQSASGAIWRYTNGTSVRLEGGVVKEIDGPGSLVPVKETGAAPVVERSAPVVTPPPTSRPAAPSPVPTPAASSPSTPSPKQPAAPQALLVDGRALTEADVVRILGAPDSKGWVTLPGGQSVIRLTYADGTQVEIISGGVVSTSLHGPGADKLVTTIKRGDKPLPAKAQSSASEPGPPPPTQSKLAEKSSPFGQTGRVIGYILGGVGALGIMVCKILLLILAFRKSTGWGLACLFLPFFPLIFIFQNLDDTKKIAGCMYLICFPLILVCIYLTP